MLLQEKQYELLKKFQAAKRKNAKKELPRNTVRKQQLIFALCN
jgi:hypothetical protein